MKKTFYVTAWPWPAMGFNTEAEKKQIEALPGVEVELQCTSMGRNNQRKLLFAASKKCREIYANWGARIGGVGISGVKERQKIVHRIILNGQMEGGAS